MWEQYAFWGVYFSGSVSCFIVGVASALDMHDSKERIRFLGAALMAAAFWPIAAPLVAGWSLWKEARP